MYCIKVTYIILMFAALVISHEIAYNNLHSINDDSNIGPPHSLLEAGKMSLFSFEYLRGNDRVVTTCKSYGCTRGVKRSGTRPGACDEKLRCGGCKKIYSPISAAEFCLHFPLRERILLLEGGLEDTGTERDWGDESEAGKSGLYDDEDSMGMSYVELGHHESAPLWSDSSEMGTSSQSAQIGYRELLKFRLKAMPITSDDKFHDCDQSVFGGSVALRIDLFFTQITLDRNSGAGKIEVRASFRGADMWKEECFAPSVYRNKIGRSELLQITLNVPIPFKDFATFHSKGFSNAIEERLNVGIVCQEKRGCNTSVYLTCVKVSCTQTVSWKKKQREMLGKMEADHKRLHEQAKAAAMEVRRKSMEYRTQQIQQIQQERRRQLAERKRQGEANAKAWEEYYKAQEKEAKRHREGMTEKRNIEEMKVETKRWTPPTKQIAMTVPTKDENLEEEEEEEEEDELDPQDEVDKLTPKIASAMSVLPPPSLSLTRELLMKKSPLPRQTVGATRTTQFRRAM